MLQREDLQRVREFLVQNVPHTVLIGTANVHCQQLHEDLSKVCDDILEHDPQVYNSTIAAVAHLIPRAAFMTKCC